MSIFNRIFGEPEIRALNPHDKAEVKKMIDQLVKIGKMDDFLSLAPGGPFDIQCHHRDAKALVAGFTKLVVKNSCSPFVNHQTQTQRRSG